MDRNQCEYPRKFTWNIFQVYSQTAFLVPHMYTNIHIYQHKIIQLILISLVHTCNMWTFDNVTVWSLLLLSSNWWVNQQTSFQNYSFHTLTSSVSMAFQNSSHILWIILHIYCPTSQNLYVFNWLVEILQ